MRLIFARRMALIFRRLTEAGVNLFADGADREFHWVTSGNPFLAAEGAY